MSEKEETTFAEARSDLCASMIHWFGAPTKTETEFAELFGWYHVDGGTVYWMSDTEHSDLKVIVGDHTPAKLAGTWEETDLAEIDQIMDHLQFLPRPPLPDDDTLPSQGELFAYEGWLLRWFFVPQLRRWELGVIERRWHPKKKEVSGPSDDASKIGAHERHSRLLSLATKTISAGADLWDQYQRSMLLLGTWIAPDPDTGWSLILGASTAASLQFKEPTDVIRSVAKATGCSEARVQSVIEYSSSTGLLDGCWFRGASSIVVVHDHELEPVN